MGRNQRAAKVGGNVPFRPRRGDGVAEYLAACAAKPLGCLVAAFRARPFLRRGSAWRRERAGGDRWPRNTPCDAESAGWETGHIAASEQQMSGDAPTRIRPVRDERHGQNADSTNMRFSVRRGGTSQLLPHRPRRAWHERTPHKVEGAPGALRPHPHEHKGR